MSAETKALKQAAGGVYAPQHYSTKKQDYEVTNGTDGATHVLVYRPIVDFAFQTVAVAPGNGAEYTASNGAATVTAEITGTSTSRTVVFEIAGPSGVFVETTAFNVSDPAKLGAQTTEGSTAAPSSWQIEVPAGYKVRARVSAVAGGNVNINAKVVV